MIVLSMLATLEKCAGETGRGTEQAMAKEKRGK